MFKTRITIHTYVRANVSILDSAYFSFPSFHFLFSSPPPPPPPSPRLSTINTRDGGKNSRCICAFNGTRGRIVEGYLRHFTARGNMFQRTFLYCWKNRGRRGGYRCERELERNFLAESLWHFKKSKLNFHI